MVIQRFGSALNLNVHLHMLFLDGAYTFSDNRTCFHRARRPTDLELALDAAVTRGLSPTIVLGGASFDRIDHFMANALLLADPRYRALQPQWWVKGAHVAPIHDSAQIHGAAGDIVTLLPIGGTAHGVTTDGLRWELTSDDLRAGSTRVVSNEMTGTTAAVRLDTGTLLAIHTRTTLSAFYL